MESLRSPISYARVSRAIAFYESVGFKYVEVPWRVFPSIADVTMPYDAVPFRCDVGSERASVLVGSAEQGFISVSNSLLDKGAYVAASPCFRDGEEDDIHFRDFFKVELFSFGCGDIQREVTRLRNFAKTFALLEGCDEVDMTLTDIGSDLTVNGIEIGSYGHRESQVIGHAWAYGTGLAEPRFSQAMKASRKS